MESQPSEGSRFAVYAADLAFLIGILLAPVLFALGYVADALVACALVVVGAAYALHRGEPWPGHAFITFWKGGASS
jgi:uncharacterized membrane protein